MFQRDCSCDFSVPPCKFVNARFQRYPLNLYLINHVEDLVEVCLFMIYLIVNKFKENNEDDSIPICVRRWPRNILNLKQCVRMLLYLPPPLPPTLGEPAVRFRTPKCEELHQGTTNSFILPQTSTLAKLAVMLKRLVPKFTKQYVMWTDRHNDPPHTCSRLQTLLDEHRA